MPEGCIRSSLKATESCSGDIDAIASNSSFWDKLLVQKGDILICMCCMIWPGGWLGMLKNIYI